MNKHEYRGINWKSEAQWLFLVYVPFMAVTGGRWLWSKVRGRQ